jgi:hypothetical protein
VNDTSKSPLADADGIVSIEEPRTAVTNIRVNKTKPAPERLPWFDPWRGARGPALRSLVATIRDALDKHEKTTGDRPDNLCEITGRSRIAGLRTVRERGGQMINVATRSQSRPSSRTFRTPRYSTRPTADLPSSPATRRLDDHRKKCPASLAALPAENEAPRKVLAAALSGASETR